MSPHAGCPSVHEVEAFSINCGHRLAQQATATEMKAQGFLETTSGVTRHSGARNLGGMPPCGSVPHEGTKACETWGAARARPLTQKTISRALQICAAPSTHAANQTIHRRLPSHLKATLRAMLRLGESYTIAQYEHQWLRNQLYLEHLSSTGQEQPFRCNSTLACRRWVPFWRAVLQPRCPMLGPFLCRVPRSPCSAHHSQPLCKAREA